MSETITIENSLLATARENGVDKNSGGIKKEAYDLFSERGLPEKKSEAYKYTPIRRILEKNFEEITTKPTDGWSKEECHRHFYELPEAYHLVFINGEFRLNYSIVPVGSVDVEIRLLNGDKQDQLPEGLGQTPGIKEDPFALLNQASFSQGLFLKVNKNTRSPQVFVYQFINGEAPAMLFPRVFVWAETGAKASVIEKAVRKGSFNVFVNSVIEIKTLANAEIRWTKLQQYTDMDYMVEGIYSDQYRDSRLYTNTLSFSGALIRNNIFISIDGENCETHMNGLYLVGSASHIDNNTAVDHRQPNSFSNELYKGIIDDRAKAVFNGKIYVRPIAQKTNAFQANNNILLSELATVNTKPQLEIWADDVKCSHGCTTGQLDQEAIFYCQSRGISKNKAKALLLNAFASEALVEIDNQQVREEIETLILSKLGV